MKYGNIFLCYFSHRVSFVGKPGFDVKRLLKDARVAASGSSRSQLGTTAQLREHLAAIEMLRAEGVPFAAIAQALAKQGVVQGKGDNQRPITASRLTALYGQMKRTDAKRALARSKRSDASEQAVEREQIASPRRNISLAAELNSQPASDTGSAVPDEETIRRKRSDRSQRFVKKPTG